MDRRELSATNWLGSRVVVGLFVLGGAFFILRADWLGYRWLRDTMGGEANLQAAGLAVAFFVLAAQSWATSRLRVEAAETLEALHQLLYGKDYRRDRDAIDILLAALESQNAENAKTAHGHLMRLTGQHFAQDPKVWRAWWEANRKTFERARAS